MILPMEGDETSGVEAGKTAMPETQAETKQDKVVFIFNFFDELRRIAPATQR